MTSAGAAPRRVRGALEEGETLVAFVKGGRRGARESQRAQNVASLLGMWAGLLAKKATEKSLGGAPVPMRCWLVATDRRLLVLSTSRTSLEAKLSRHVVLSRVRGAKVRTAGDKMAYARIALMDNRDLEVEVPLGDLPALTTVIDAVQAAAGELGATRHRTYRTTMG